MTILIVGDPEDLSAAYIGWLAEKRGAKVCHLPEATFGVEWAFAFDDHYPEDGLLMVDDQAYKFGDLSGAFVRLNPNPAAPDLLSDLADVEHATYLAERRSALEQFLNCLPCPVANRPGAGRSNGSKPFQMRLLQEFGFLVPSWVVTNDADSAATFLDECPKGAVYKACSGLRSRVRLYDDLMDERLRAGTTPVVIQEYIPGRDVRLHMVGDLPFATEAISQGVDYRFETEGNEFQETEAAPSIVQLSKKVAEFEALLIAGLDFRVTEDGTWHCLEMNPVPTFLPYEMATGQAIGDSLLDILLGAN